MKMVDFSALEGLRRHPLSLPEATAVHNAIQIIQSIVPVGACSVVREADLALDTGYLEYNKEKLFCKVGKALYENGFIREEESELEDGCRKILFYALCVRKEDPKLEKYTVVKGGRGRV